MKHIVIMLALLLVSCASEFEPLDALNTIAAQSEFKHPLYAPLHLGREVLTGINHTNPDNYIKTKYATLIKTGLVKYDITEKNSWRTLVVLSLTDKAADLIDVPRTKKFQQSQGENDVFYVAVCDLIPETVIGVDTIARDTMNLRYNIVERRITPFGEFLGFEDGRTHQHNRPFIRSTFHWVAPATSTL